MKETIWVVEDDEVVLAALKDCLALSGYKPVLFSNAEDALKRMELSRPDLLLLDIRLGRLSGLQLLDVVKRSPETAGIPVILLTSMGAEDQKVAGLKAGADDYVVKPFSPRELTARVEAVLRRSVHGGKPERVLCAGEIEVNLDTRQVLVGGKELSLSRANFGLLSYFLARKKLVHTYADLAANVWGEGRVATSHTVAVAVYRLKTKLGEAGEKIQVVSGIGYRFVE